MKQTIEELKDRALLHWPSEILRNASLSSSLPHLLNSQDAFISILKIADQSPLSWRNVLNENTLITPKLFLKHLMVLTDIGGEALNKITPIDRYLSNGKMKYEWKDEIHEFQFEDLRLTCALTNSALGVDSKGLSSTDRLNRKCTEVVMLLLFGSSAVNDSLPQEIKDRANIGSMLGQPLQIEAFVRQSYIRVSKQVSGATANALGQLAQQYVAEFIKKRLPNTWKTRINSSIPHVRHSAEGNNTNFDVVVTSPEGKFFAIEISFQVTTNSTIERKSRESLALMSAVKNSGNFLCYVIDGAGNINIRENAIKTLCENSDIAVTMAESELERLISFMISEEK